jgi:hypothetical protein
MRPHLIERIPSHSSLIVSARSVHLGDGSTDGSATAERLPTATIAAGPGSGSLSFEDELLVRLACLEKAMSLDLVRHLFFEGLPKERLVPLSEALEAIYDHVVQHGTLPAPASEP